MLDFQKIAGKISALASNIRQGEAVHGTAVKRAYEALTKHADNWSALRERISAEKRTIRWLAALPTDALNAVYPLPSCPSTYTVVATDGSQIDLERHRAIPCSVINIGNVMLAYGEHPDAVLESDAEIFYEDTAFAEDGESLRRQVQGSLVSAKRDIEEMRHLAKHAVSHHATLAMVDGTLIRWSLESLDEQLKKRLITEYCEALAIFADNTIPVCGYISDTRAKEVVDLLRIALCPHEKVNCTICAQNKEHDLSHVRDAEVFGKLLSEGERSGVFESQSSILEYYGRSTVAFFYLHTGTEIARIELPQWLAQNRRMVDHVHTLCMDQLRRGGGYPVSLMEAHEQAVIGQGDRESFYWLVDQEVAQGGLTVHISEKALSKRIRQV